MSEPVRGRFRTPSGPSPQDAPFQREVVLGGDARRAVSEVNRFFSKTRLEKEAAQDERGRLARELHDGLLQSLTAATLQLDAIARLVATDPSDAVFRARTLQRILSDQQRDLRRWIEQLRAEAPVAQTSVADLLAALEKLRHRAAWQGAMRVELNVTGTRSVPRELGEHIYRIVQESLTNVARHARAMHARVAVRISFDRVWISIADDGIGFPVHGQYRLADLVRRQFGPVSLRDRVGSLGGDMMLTSSHAGSQLDIALPLQG